MPITFDGHALLCMFLFFTALAIVFPLYTFKVLVNRYVLSLNNRIISLILLFVSLATPLCDNTWL